jgi:hypothetical protein
MIYWVCLLYLPGQNITNNLEFITGCSRVMRQGVVGAGLDDPGFDLLQVQEIFMFSQTSTLDSASCALGKGVLSHR